MYNFLQFRVNSRPGGALIHLWETFSPQLQEDTMKNFKLTIAALTLGVFALPAFAQTNTPNMDRRQAEQPKLIDQGKASSPLTDMDKRQSEQQKRIDQGKASGQLTDKEAASLEKSQAKVQKMIDKAKEDGEVTDGERKSIEAEQKKLSQHINKSKFDKQHK